MLKNKCSKLEQDRVTTYAAYKKSRWLLVVHTDIETTTKGIIHQATYSRRNSQKGKRRYIIQTKMVV